MEVITIAARKGGDGKTTTAQSVGAGLCLKGYKVLYVDLDSQRNLTRRLDSLETDYTIYDALTAKAPGEILKAATKLTDNISIIAGSLNLANFEKDNAEKPEAFKSVGNILKPFKNDYDYAIIDTSANFGLSMVSALNASDKVIIPMQATADSLQGMQNLVRIIERVQLSNEKLKIAGILPTRWRKRVITQNILDVAQKYAAQKGIKVFEPIRETIAIQEAELMKKDIYSYSKKSNAAKDYESLIDNII